MVTYIPHLVDVADENTGETRQSWYYETIMRVDMLTLRGYGVTLEDALVDVKRRARDRT